MRWRGSGNEFRQLRTRRAEPVATEQRCSSQPNEWNRQSDFLRRHPNTKIGDMKGVRAFGRNEGGLKQMVNLWRR
jgi:hypothetical protein